MSPTETTTANKAVPLFVDLDGSLIATDVFSESLLLAARNPIWAVQIPFWFLFGRAYLKRKVAERVGPSVQSLPYQTDVVKYLKREHAAGRPIILATATDSVWANEVADLLGLFQHVLSSDGRENLKGARKLAAIETYCREQGFDEFAYIGDSNADFAIWREAAEVYVVKPSPRMLAATRAIGKPGRAFGKRGPRWRQFLKAFHYRRWLKNLLIAVPLLFAGRPSAASIVHVIWAIVAFTSVATSGYLLEELLAIENDRFNAARRKRLFSSGELSIGDGVILVLACLAVGVLAYVTKLPALFGVPLVAYFVGRICYTGILKRGTLTDVLWVAAFDTMRVIAGVIAIGAPLSAKWILGPLVVFSFAQFFLWRQQKRARKKFATIW